MAAAASNAGGLGSIGVGSVDADVTRQMIAAVTQPLSQNASKRPFFHRQWPHCIRPDILSNFGRRQVRAARLAVLATCRVWDSGVKRTLFEILATSYRNDALRAVLCERVATQGFTAIV